MRPDDLRAALRRHYEPPPSKPHGGALVTELTSPNGTRRIAAIWAPLTPTERGTLVGHELKVSRSDVVQELRDPMKADGWEPYCSRWWLVIPGTDIIDGLDIPDRWGIMCAPKGANRRRFDVHRPAPALNPTQDVAVGVATVLASTMWRVSVAEHDLRLADDRAKGYQDEATRLRKKQREHESATGDGRGSIFHTANEVVEALNKRVPDLPGLSVDIDDVVEAVMIATAGRSAKSHYLTHNANLLVDRFHQLSTALHQAVGATPPQKPTLPWREEL